MTAVAKVASEEDRPSERRMTFFEHIEELRQRLKVIVIVYELGQFIGPALKPSEKRLILRITVPVVLLFLSGVALCFIVVLPFTFNLLYSVQTVLGANFLVLYGDDFIDFVLLFTLAFGLAFQLPVLMYGRTRG